MITLNLLDPSLQKKIRMELLLVLWRMHMAMLVIVSGMVGILFVISRALLINDFQDSVQRMNIISNRNHPVMVAIKELNETIVSLRAVQAEYTVWSGWLMSFSETVTPGNVITELSMDQTTKRFTVRGTSKRRDDLLAFKERLEQSGLVEDIDFPNSNYLMRENIDFNFTATVVPLSVP